MPATRIETRRGWIKDRKIQIIAAVQDALVSALKLPEHDRCVRLLEYDEDAIITPQGKGPFYMVIEVTLFSGRTIDAKRNLYAALTDRLFPFGIPATDVKIVLVEVPASNWGLGGVPASEIELGYKIDV